MALGAASSQGHVQIFTHCLQISKMEERCTMVTKDGVQCSYLRVTTEATTSSLFFTVGKMRQVLGLGYLWLHPDPQKEWQYPLGCVNAPRTTDELREQHGDLGAGSVPV